MEKEFQIPDNIQVIDKPEDYNKIIFDVKKPMSNTTQLEKSNINTIEKTYEGYTIPDNILVFEKLEDVNQQIDNDLPTSLTNPESENNLEELDIWEQVENDFDSTDFLTEDSGGNTKLDKEKLFIWLKEKLSGISFCQTYLSDKVDAENGVVKENATLMLETEKGSKFFVNKAGKYHRLDGPAIEWNYGAKEYFKNGIRHRLDGPAYESKEEKQFWFEGKQYIESEYWIVSKEIENLK